MSPVRSICVTTKKICSKISEIRRIRAMNVVDALKIMYVDTTCQKLNMKKKTDVLQIMPALF